MRKYHILVTKYTRYLSSRQVLPNSFLIGGPGRLLLHCSYMSGDPTSTRFFKTIFLSGAYFNVYIIVI